MDTIDLKTASTYVNNLLLARGLLRDGQPIQFARPHRAVGGTEKTLAQILNLVHDMILKRDREQEHRERLAQTIQTLSTESTKTANENHQLKNKLSGLDRQHVQSQTREHAAIREAKASESNTKTLRDELIKLNNTIGQIRATCAHDIRKRDLQIRKLKAHLISQQRGNRSVASGMTILIQPGTNSLANGSSRDIAAQHGQLVSAHDAGQHLKRETNTFLAELCRKLGDENEKLVTLCQCTLGTLEELQGLSHNVQQLNALDALAETNAKTGLIHVSPVDPDILANDMNRVLDSLQSLLTNPNYVSIDEVAVREDEIQQLRSGWDRMEEKWRKIILMMNSWRERIQNGEETIDLDEIKKVLGFGKNVKMPPGRSRQNNINQQDVDCDDNGDRNICSGLDNQDGDEEEESQDDEQPERLPLHQSSRSNIQLPVRRQATKVIQNIISPEKATFQYPQVQEHMEPALRLDMMADDDRPTSEPTDSAHSSHTTISSRSVEQKLHPQNQPSNTYSQVIPVMGADDRTLENIDPDTGSQPSSSPLEPHPDEDAKVLTIQEKLNVAQAEAEASAVAAGLRLDCSEDTKSKEIIVEKHKLRKFRKTNVSGHIKRRKSTLTPDELEKLLYI